MTRDRLPADPEPSLAGSLLLAHPALTEPTFRRTVILIAAHSVKDGAMGVILNRPKHTTLAETDAGLAPTSIGALPIYHGGPVSPESIIFAGWNWDGPHRKFQLHFGIERQAIDTIRAEAPEATLRAFAGYAGWSSGQLEKELTTPTWIICRIDPVKIDSLDGRDLWRTLIKQTAPQFVLEADAPDVPEAN